MKLKTLVGSMVVLGLVSTGTFAAPATAKAMKNSNSDQAFWNAVVNRNQDNAYFVMPNAGQVKVTGAVATDLKHTSKGGANAQDKFGFDADKSKTAFSLHTAELYLDAGLPSVMLAGRHLNTTVHVALDHDYDLTKNLLDGSISDSSDPYVTSTGETMFFPEAYVMMTYDHLFAKVGRQYVNFGATSYDSISIPVTETLSQTNKVGVTLGVMNLNGFYGDVAFYNGAANGSSDSDIRDSRNKVNGFAAELGYAMMNNDYHFNTYVDYISNMADVAAINYIGGISHRITKDANATHDKVPGVALHGDFTMAAGADSSFTVMGDYVTATKKFDVHDLPLKAEHLLAQRGIISLAKFDNDLKHDEGEKPQAYSIEGDYTFMKRHTVSLGFQGTKKASGMVPYAGFGSPEATDLFTMPKTRLLGAYTYQLNKYVSFEGEYTNDKDYGISDGGTGKTNNTIVGRIKVKF